MKPYKPWVHQIDLRQAADSCAPKDVEQHLDITIEDAGGGHYIVIKTKRWALDPEDFVALAKYLKRLCDDADKALDKALESTDFPGSDLLSEIE